MLLEKRPILIHSEGFRGWVEFHSTDGVVECQIFREDGKPDYGPDGNYAVLMFYRGEKSAEYLSLKRCKGGILYFPRKTVNEDWSQGTPNGRHRIVVLTDTELDCWKITNRTTPIEIIIKLFLKFVATIKSMVKETGIWSFQL